MMAFLGLHFFYSSKVALVSSNIFFKGQIRLFRLQTFFYTCGIKIFKFSLKIMSKCFQALTNALRFFQYFGG